MYVWLHNNSVPVAVLHAILLKDIFERARIPLASIFNPCLGAQESMLFLHRRSSKHRTCCEILALSPSAETTHTILRTPVPVPKHV